jgi:hypothetical protein
LGQGKREKQTAEATVLVHGKMYYKKDTFVSEKNIENAAESMMSKRNSPKRRRGKVK